MLRSLRSLKNSVVLATDGEIGNVHEFLFDDEKWTVRYCVVKTAWLAGRKVLVSPLAIAKMEADLHFIRVSLTRQQVEQSPDIDTDKPISRQMETRFHDYHRWPYYWEGSAIWGSAPYPSGILSRPYPLPSRPPDEFRDFSEPVGDVHLRSVHVVEGYEILAKDDIFGHVADVIIDDESWTIRYLVIDMRRIVPGKAVIISPQWVTSMSWSDRTVSINLTKEQIEKSPEYRPDAPINREYEERLYDYYGRPAYWPKDSSSGLGAIGKTGKRKSG
jgi:hypothetical protein